MITLTKFCCEYIRDFCDDPRVQITYSPVFREYHIPLKGNAARQRILYCPWCGTKLPTSVRDNYYELLDDAQLEDPPEEFQGDTWWRNRSL